MAHDGNQEYRCTLCGEMTKRELLLAVTVAFAEIGSAGRVIRKRTVGWLCPNDVADSALWNLPAWNAPGNRPPSEDSEHRGVLQRLVRTVVRG